MGPKYSVPKILWRIVLDYVLKTGDDIFASSVETRQDTPCGEADFLDAGPSSAISWPFKLGESESSIQNRESGFNDP